MAIKFIDAVEGATTSASQTAQDTNIDANAADIAALNTSQAAQDALIAATPTQAQVDALQATQDAEDPYSTFARQPDGSINWTRESGATGTIAAAATAAETDPVFAAAKPAIDAHIADADIHVTVAQKAAWDAKVDQTALDSEIASTDTEQTAQDAAIALKADQTALDAEVTARTGADTSLAARVTPLEAQDPLSKAHIADADIHVTKAQKDAWDAHPLDRAFHAPAATVADNGKVQKVDASGQVVWGDVASQTGQYVGVSTTYAGLPAIPSDASATIKYHVWLSEDDIGTGDAQNPQYPKGVYVPDAAFAIWELAVATSANVAELTETDVVSVAGDSAFTKFGLTSTQRLDQHHFDRSRAVTIADGETLQEGRVNIVTGGTVFFPNNAVEGDVFEVANDAFFLTVPGRALNRTILDGNGSNLSSSQGFSFSSISLSPGNSVRFVRESGGFFYQTDGVYYATLTNLHTGMELRGNVEYDIVATVPAMEFVLPVQAIGRITGRTASGTIESYSISQDSSVAGTQIVFEDNTVNTSVQFGPENTGEEYVFSGNGTQWRLTRPSVVAATKHIIWHGDIADQAVVGRLNIYPEGPDLSTHTPPDNRAGAYYSIATGDQATPSINPDQIDYVSNGIAGAGHLWVVKTGPVVELPVTETVLPDGDTAVIGKTNRVANGNTLVLPAFVNGQEFAIATYTAAGNAFETIVYYAANEAGDDWAAKDDTTASGTGGIGGEQLTGVTGTGTTTISYTGDPSFGWQAEVQVNIAGTDYWIPMNFDSNDAVSHFRAWHTPGVGFSFNTQGVNINNRPYRITIYQDIGQVGYILETEVVPVEPALAANPLAANEEPVTLDGIEVRMSSAERQMQIRAATGTIQIEGQHSLSQGTAIEGDFGTKTLTTTWQNLDITDEAFSVSGAQERFHFRRTDTNAQYLVSTRLGSGFNNNSIIFERLDRYTVYQGSTEAEVTGNVGTGGGTIQLTVPETGDYDIFMRVYGAGAVPTTTGSGGHKIEGTVSGVVLSDTRLMRLGDGFGFSATAPKVSLTVNEVLTMSATDFGTGGFNRTACRMFLRRVA